jgi:hypothetical protein
MISHALVPRDACARGPGAIIAPGIWPVLRNEPYGKTQLENVRSKVQGCAVSCPAGIKVMLSRSSGGSRPGVVAKFLWAESLKSNTAVPSALILARLIFNPPTTSPLAWTLEAADMIWPIHASLTGHGIGLERLFASAKSPRRVGTIGASHK